MRLTASTRTVAMAAVLVVSLAGAATAVAAGSAAAASSPPVMEGGRAAALGVAPAVARIPAGLARAVLATQESARRLGASRPVAWSQSAELTEPGLSPLNPGNDNHYGWSVAMSSNGTTAAIGAPRAGVFVYKNVRGTWTLTGTLTGGSGPWSVAVSADGSTVVVGSPDLLGTSSSVSIYSDRSGSWAETASLPAIPSGTLEGLGSSVAISGDGKTAAAVAAGYPGANPETGAVFIYQLSKDGWKLTGLITGTSAGGLGTTYDNEDLGLSATGSTLVVGNADTSSPATGSVSVFSHDGNRWVNTATLTPSDGQAGDEFGSAVAISADGSTVVAGGQFGIGLPPAAYVFRKSKKTWNQTGELTGTWGSSLAVSANGSAVLAGNQGASVDGNGDVGEAILYNLSGGTWTQTATLTPSDTTPGTQLGYSVALSGSGLTALAGAPYQDVGTGSQVGAAYIYTG